MPNSETRGSGQGAYVRTATVYDLDELAAMTQRAFISSPPQTFFSGATAVRARFFFFKTHCAPKFRLLIVIAVAIDHRPKGRKTEGTANPFSQVPYPQIVEFGCADYRGGGPCARDGQS
jgi:hypothetical protein